MRFQDRLDAGRQLADKLMGHADGDSVVLALPRGGVITGDAVAARLAVPLDVFVARKIGAPGHEELGIGAVAEGGEPIYDEASLQRLGLDPDDLGALVERERTELRRRVERYRGSREPLALSGRTVLLVDDGLATGVTAHAALAALQARSPARLVLAVPVAAPTSVRRLAEHADEIVTVALPAGFVAVGQWYDSFLQTTDEEVVDVLRRARERTGSEQR